MKLFPYAFAAAVSMILSIALPATVKADVLHFFNSSDGSRPTAGLTLSGSGLYGTTSGGGTDASGTLYMINGDGSGFQVVHNFASKTDGANPGAVSVVNGAVFGTTASAGSGGAGAVYRMNPDGTSFQVLHSFSDAAVTGPRSSLTISGNSIFGTTWAGGANDEGTVFRLNTDGSNYQVLHDFASFPSSGGVQPLGGLTLVASTLYGTSSVGGANGDGALFSMQTDGTNFQVLHSFGSFLHDGAVPTANLTLIGSTLLGVASTGGDFGAGAVFRVSTDGSGYQVLHSFGGSAQAGTSPTGSLILLGEKLYGTTATGGANGKGEVFSMNPDGSSFQVAYNFAGGNADGSFPNGALATFGNSLYGVTSEGGIANLGSIYVLSVPEPDAVTLAVIALLGFTGSRIRHARKRSGLRSWRGGRSAVAGVAG